MQRNQHIAGKKKQHIFLLDSSKRWIISKNQKILSNRNLYNLLTLNLNGEEARAYARIKMHAVGHIMHTNSAYSISNWRIPMSSIMFWPKPSSTNLFGIQFR